MRGTSINKSQHKNPMSLAKANNNYFFMSFVFIIGIIASANPVSKHIRIRPWMAKLFVLTRMSATQERIRATRQPSVGIQRAVFSVTVAIIMTKFAQQVRHLKTTKIFYSQSYFQFRPTLICIDENECDQSRNYNQDLNSNFLPKLRWLLFKY